MQQGFSEVMIEKRLLKENLWSLLQLFPSAALLPHPPSPLGEGLATFPKLLMKVPFFPCPPKRLCSVPSNQLPSLPAWLPCPERPLLNSPHVQESRAWPCWVCSKLLAAWPLIYLLMHSLPSVFILLSAQDKWFPHSAELQRLQSS